MEIQGLKPGHLTAWSKDTAACGGLKPFSVIKQRLGHSRIATTLDIYSHVTAAMQEEAVDKLNVHFQQSREE